MREYVKVSPAFWTGKTGREIKRTGLHAQLVALYLLSSPHTNYIGLYRLPASYIAADTNLSAAEVESALAAIEAAGFAKYDYDSETVFVVEAAEFQIGKLTGGDKRVAMVQREFDELPSDCTLIEEFYAKYKESLQLMPHRSSTKKPAAKPSAPAAKPAAKPASKTEAKPAAKKAEASAKLPAEVVKAKDDFKAWVAVTVPDFNNERHNSYIDKLIAKASAAFSSDVVAAALLAAIRNKDFMLDSFDEALAYNETRAADEIKAEIADCDI